MLLIGKMNIRSAAWLRVIAVIRSLIARYKGMVQRMLSVRVHCQGNVAASALWLWSYDRPKNRMAARVYR